MRAESITCDVCGAVKRAVNHWFVVGRNEGVIYIVTSGDVRGASGQTSDLCGESCVLKKISELIEGKT